VSGITLGLTDPVFFEMRDPASSTSTGMRRPNREYYYYRSVRNQIIVFMSLFKGMKVIDTEDSDETLDNTVETLIDITYAPKERKLIEQLYEHTSPDSMYDTKVPRFSVSIANITYDGERALSFYRSRRIKQNSNQFNDRMPIPYNIDMNLAILAKYESHIHQISENIVPFIAPYIIVKIKENIAFLNEIPRELRIDFDGNVNRDIPIEWADTERRIVKSDLNFTIRGWIYKPISEAPGPILTIPIRFFNHEDFDLNTSLMETTEVSSADLLSESEITGPNWT